jgi:small-conductance mechanosensitive channel
VRELVQAAVSAQPQATFDRCHLANFAASSLDFETVYWVESPDYNTYVNAHHNIAVALVESFGREGIEFAYPTQVQIERKPS